MSSVATAVVDVLSSRLALCVGVPMIRFEQKGILDHLDPTWVKFIGQRSRSHTG